MFLAQISPVTFFIIVSVDCFADRQKVSGNLTSRLANIVGLPLDKLVEKYPATALENVWATVLALTLLKERFSSQEQEWELVAMKAEMWLQDQTIPGPHSLDQLSQDAKQCPCLT